MTRGGRSRGRFSSGRESIPISQFRIGEFEQREGLSGNIFYGPKEFFFGIIHLARPGYGRSALGCGAGTCKGSSGGIGSVTDHPDGGVSECSCESTGLERRRRNAISRCGGVYVFRRVRGDGSRREDILLLIGGRATYGARRSPR